MQCTNATTGCKSPAMGRKLRATVIVHESKAGQNAESATNGKPISTSTPNIVLPKRGFLSIADTKQEVYVKGKAPFDPTKRGGRWESDFIWNTDWQKSLDEEEAAKKAAQEYAEQQANLPKESGFLSFSRLSELDDMNIDLSQKLIKKDPSPAPNKSSSSTSASTTKPGSVPLGRREFKSFDRTSRLNNSSVTVGNVDSDAEEKLRAVELERIQYEQQKTEYTLWTLAFAALGFGATLSAYTTDIAWSYLVGAMGGVAYLRLLSRSVDGVGGGSVESGLSSVAGQPRLLIPVVLALTYNRWNTLYADKTDVHLQLLPILVGFFTYKLAVVARQSVDVMNEINKRDPPSS